MGSGKKDPINPECFSLGAFLLFFGDLIMPQTQRSAHSFLTIQETCDFLAKNFSQFSSLKGVSTLGGIVDFMREFPPVEMEIKIYRFEDRFSSFLFKWYPKDIFEITLTPNPTGGYLVKTISPRKSS